MFVVDTSVTMAWCFADEATDATDALLDGLESESAIVPAIWPLEVSNVLLGAERRGRVTEAQAGRFLALLARLPLEVDRRTDPTEIMATGRRHSLSAYDASYLVLAERHGLALATLDRALATASRSAGVGLLLPVL